MFLVLHSYLLEFLKLFRREDPLQLLAGVLADCLDLLFYLLLIDARVGPERLDLRFSILQDRMDFGFLFLGEVQLFQRVMLPFLIALLVFSRRGGRAAGIGRLRHKIACQ